MSPASVTAPLEATTTRKNTLAALATTAALSACAVAGNHFHLPLFFRVDFIFGSIFALIAVCRIGLLPGTIVALIGGSYTIALWGHPYAMLIFGAEALVTGLLWKRRVPLAAANAVFWLLIGAPLVYLFYSGALHLNTNQVLLIALKQPLNGIMDAAFADLLLMASDLARLRFAGDETRRPSIARLLFGSVLAIVLISTLVPLVLESRNLRDLLERETNARLHEVADGIATHLKRRPDDIRGATELAIIPETMSLSLIERSGDVIAGGGEIKQLSERGAITSLPSGARVWLPSGEMAEMSRWNHGMYVHSRAIDGHPSIRLVVVEQSAAALVARLEEHRLQMMVLLVLLAVLALVVAAAFSSWTSRSLQQLDALSQNLPARVRSGAIGQPIESLVLEYHNISRSLADVTTTLNQNFDAMRSMRDSLEVRVAERTDELQDREAFFRDITEAQTDLIYRYRPDDTISYVNPALAGLLGRSQSELIGSRCSDTVAAEARRALIPDPASLSPEQPIANRESELLDSSGQQRWFRWTDRAFFDADGTIEFIQSTGQDITGRKRAEDALIEKQRSLHLALDASRAGYYLLDLAEGRADWDERTYEIYGQSPEHFETTMANVMGTGLPEDSAMLDRFQALLASTSHDWHDVYRVRAADGRTRVIEGFGYIVRAEDDTPLKVVGTVVDITERRAAEQALEEAARHTQAILDNIVDGIVTIDIDGTVTSYNRAAAEIFQSNGDDLLGSKINSLLPQVSQAPVDMRSSSTFAIGAAPVIAGRHETVGLREDGAPFPAEVGISEVSHRGEPVFIVVVRDITERRRVERLKSEFVATVSHELRTPLTSIAGAIGLLLGGAAGELPASSKQMLELAQRNGERLGELVNDLLDVERLLAGKMRFDLQPHDLGEIVRRTVDEGRAFGERFGVRFAFSEPPAKARVRVDGGRLQQVLTNLLSNGAKFSPSGSTVEVAIRPNPTHHSARVEVRDQGPGVPEEFQKQLFMKFSQADSSDARKRGGAGLGLAISKELIEQMGGTIGFVSTADVGSTFFFELPLYDEPRSSSDDPSQPLRRK